MTAAIGSAARSRGPSAFARACDALGAVLSGGARREIVAALVQGADPKLALRRLRTALRAHSFRTASGAVELEPWVTELDAVTRRDGFHAFLEWHEVAYRFIEEDIPVVLLDSVAAAVPELSSAEGAAALLLDYYFLYLLALCATRVWDEGDPAANLARLDALIAELQGSGGSGRRFVDGAEAALWTAVSTYEPDDLAYHRLLARAAALEGPRRTALARSGAALLGCHLRWGFPHLYESDLFRMRADNFIDYPWLCFSLARLMEEYERLCALEREGGRRTERGRIAGLLLNGLSPDPDAFLGEAPASLAGRAEEHAGLRAGLLRRRVELLEDFARHDPARLGYSPLGFHFNFPHNALFAMATVALLDPGAPNVSLDALAAGPASDGEAGPTAELAKRLTAFAAAHPEPRGSRSVLGLYYDPEAARKAFDDTTRALAGAADPA